MLIRDYRVDVTQAAINLAGVESGSDSDSPLALAIRARYPDSTVTLNGNIAVIEFSQRVLMFGLGTDAIELHRRFLAGEPIEPREVHIWRAFKTGQRPDESGM